MNLYDLRRLEGGRMPACAGRDSFEELEFANLSMIGRVATLMSGDSTTLTWNLTALSHSEVSQLIFSVASDNGGNYSIFEGVEIYAKD